MVVVGVRTSATTMMTQVGLRKSGVTHCYAFLVHKPSLGGNDGGCYDQFMMTSSNGNIFRVTGHVCGEFTGLRWIPRTKASDAELWCFLWSASGWENNRGAGDFRGYRAHYDVIVIWWQWWSGEGGDRDAGCEWEMEWARNMCSHEISLHT